MDDLVGKIWFTIIGVFFVFTIPVMLFTMKQDVTIQNYVDNVAHEFVDTSRAKGYIDQLAYDNLIARLDSTGNVYDIEVTHYVEKDYPVYSGDGTTVENYESGYEVKTTTEIINDIYGYVDEDGTEHEGGRHKMYDGDRLKIQIKNQSPTVGRRMMSLVFMGNTDGGQIFTSYGGYVGNEG